MLTILHELFRMFVDTEVGQMNISFANILGFNIVLICSESCQPILKHIYPQRIIAGHQDINSQIVLEVVNQMRITNVL